MVQATCCAGGTSMAVHSIIFVQRSYLTIVTESSHQYPGVDQVSAPDLDPVKPTT